MVYNIPGLFLPWPLNTSFLLCLALASSAIVSSCLDVPFEFTYGLNLLRRCVKTKLFSLWLFCQVFGDGNKKTQLIQGV